jgi:TetR/AcrR family transcriptional regulator, fatty acid metabolism regulator protein
LIDKSIKQCHEICRANIPAQNRFQGQAEGKGSSSARCQPTPAPMGQRMKNLQDSKKIKEQAIIDAALKVMKRKGFHKARMADISRDAGISYGLVYHYFGTKEELFETILERWWDSLFTLMGKIGAASKHVQQQLGQIILFFLNTYQEHPELVNIFITEISRSTANLNPKRLDRFKRFISLTENIIAGGQDKGFLRHDFKARYLTYIFLGSLETFVSAMVLVDQKIKGDAQKERIARSILEVFLNGAKNRKKKARS